MCIFFVITETTRWHSHSFRLWITHNQKKWLKKVQYPFISRMLRFSIFCVTYINLGKLPKIHQWLVDYNVIEDTVNCSYLVGCIQILFKYFLVNRATLPPWNKQQALYVMYSRSCTVMTVGVICDWSWRKRLIIIKRPGAGGHSFVTHSSLLIIIREVVRWMDFC